MLDIIHPFKHKRDKDNVIVMAPSIDSLPDNNIDDDFEIERNGLLHFENLLDINYPGTHQQFTLKVEET